MLYHFKVGKEEDKVHKDDKLFGVEHTLIRLIVFVLPPGLVDFLISLCLLQGECKVVLGGTYKGNYICRDCPGCLAAITGFSGPTLASFLRFTGAWDLVR